MPKTKRANIRQANILQYEVENILSKSISDQGKVHYWVKWAGFGSNDNTWETFENLIDDCPELVKAFESKMEGLVDEATSFFKDIEGEAVNHDAPMERTANEVSSESQTDRSFKIERIITSRIRDGLCEYYIKWVGYGFLDNSWESETDVLAKSPTMLEAYKKKRANQKQAVKVQTKKRKQNSTSAQQQSAKEKNIIVPERILGCTPKPTRSFLVKLAGVDEVAVVPATEANKSFPQAVINFYQQRLIWARTNEPA